MLIDYTYDNNGNLLKDRNNDIGNAGTSGITYNHLNLPYKVWVSGKGTITYIYDAAGNKLEKRTYDSTISKATRTTYLGGYVYQNDTLQFLGHEEGRIRKKPDHSFVYDYFIKDHLGNTRMVLTEEYEQNTYPVATFETGATATEGEYYNINTGKIVDTSAATGFSAASGSNYANNNGNPPYNSNPSSVVTATSTKLYKLNGNTGDKTGLGITLKVMSGDTVSIYGKSYWHNNVGTPDNSYSLIVNDLLTALAGTNAIASANKGATSGALTGSSVIPGDVTSWLTNAPSAGSGPKAYINWILFDEQFRVVTGSSGFHKVSGTSDVIDSFGTAVNITRNGYLYVYCSNESNTDVFFDNLQVIHNKGPLLEETHYYPFGLTMAGISSKAAGKLENRTNKFQGQELDDDLGINYYGFKWRNHDPQIGRFIQIDPLSDKYVYNSTYAFSENKVTSHVELEGLEAWSIAPTLRNISGLQNMDSRTFVNRLGTELTKPETYTRAVEMTGPVLGGLAIGVLTDMLLSGTTTSASMSSLRPTGIVNTGATVEGEVAELSALKPTSNITQNAAKGAAWEAEVGGQIQVRGDIDVSPQLTLETQSGGRTRMDFTSRDVNGNIRLTEAKGSSTAPLTKGQKGAHPEIAKTGAVVKGAGSDAFPAGTKIPPTQVEIIRPTSKNQ